MAAGPLPRQTIWRIEPYVPGKPIEEVRQELGIADPIKLASNENPLGPSPRALAALGEWAAEAHRYPDGGCRALKAALAERLGLDPAHFIIGNGSDEVIKMIGESFLQPGDEVLFADPTFSEYAYVARLMGATEVRVPLAGYRHDLEAMAAAITPRTKLIFICNPNNPTGTIVEQEALDAFLAQVPSHVLVIFDEAYVDYVTAPRFPDTLAYVRQGRPVVVLRTFSKIYGLAGLRVGYGVAPHELAAVIGRVREPFNVNAAAQVAARAALADEAYLEQSRRLNAQGVERLMEALPRLGVRPVPTQANFVFIDTGRDSRAVFHSLLRKGIIVRTGDVFGCPSHIRVTVGTPEENERFLRALEETLSELPLAERAAR